MDETALDAAKADARRAARAVRASLVNPGAGHRLAATFPAQLVAPVVAGYWPLGSEIDPRPLMAALAAKGAEIVLPRLDTRFEPPAFRRWRDGDRLSPDAFGILAPGADAEVLDPALILTPLLAFDRRGRRLGQGGGHYDRVLARLKPLGVVAVGLAYAGQELPEVPAGPMDQTLNWVVTEQEAIRIADGA